MPQQYHARVSSDEIALVQDGFHYLYYGRADERLLEILKNPGARLLRADISTFPPLWDRYDDLDGDAQEPFRLAALHLWQHGINFDYLDIGAGNGRRAITQAVFHKRQGREDRIHAFEPGIELPLLIMGVEANRVGDIVSVTSHAVSDIVGRAEFYLPVVQAIVGSMFIGAVKRAKPRITTRTVQTITIDHYMSSIRSNSGVMARIGTKGADFMVLSGMEKTMKDRPCILQVEFSPSVMTYTDPAERLRELTEEFYLIDIGDDPSRLIGADDISVMVERVAAMPMAVTDIFMIAKSIPESEVLRDCILAG